VSVRDTVRYHVEGWFDGYTEVYPPEPGKRWLAIMDDEGNEVAVVVQRQRAVEPLEPREYVEEDTVLKQAQAEMIVEALNARTERG
jgi:hypothetical protein